MAPQQDNDLLAAVLERTGLQGRVYCRTSAPAPWGLHFAPRDGAVFHAIAAGTCWLRYGTQRVQLGAGDIVLFPRGSAHTLSDAPRTASIELEDWLARRAPAKSVHDAARGRSDPLSSRCDVLCGVYEFKQTLASQPVLELLPDCLHVRLGLQRSELAGTLASLLGEHERGALGSHLVIRRLLDIMFVQLVRAWVETAAAGSTGWIGALADDSLARALAAIHREPARAWTVEKLAQLGGCSRATLARRFRDQLAEAPLAYVTKVRLELAASRLLTDAASLAEVAQAVGYASEFAFSRAFRRFYGEAPGQYRLQRAR